MCLIHANLFSVIDYLLPSKGKGRFECDLWDHHVSRFLTSNYSL